MHKIIKNIFSTEQCNNLIEIASGNLSEKVVTHTGQEISRSYQNEKWKYFFTRLHKTDIQQHFETVDKKLPEYEIISFRTMHYPAGAMIGRHTDSYMKEDGESNTGFIIQLTDPNFYGGGYLRMANELIELDQGDAVLYSYDTPHEVTKIKSGNRWIASIRLLLKR